MYIDLNDKLLSWQVKLLLDNRRPEMIRERAHPVLPRISFNCDWFSGRRNPSMRRARVGPSGGVVSISRASARSARCALRDASAGSRLLPRRPSDATAGSNTIAARLRLPGPSADACRAGASPLPWRLESRAAALASMAD